MLACLCLLFSVFCPLTVEAVDTLHVTSPDPILEDWRWTVFDESDGVAGRVSKVFEDREQNIWFATREGAQMYDGTTWTTYTTEDGLADNIVKAVIQAQDGAMWFGTGKGISRLEFGSDGTAQWTTHTFGDSVNSVGSGSLCQSNDGAIWAGFDEGNNPAALHGIRRYADGKWSLMKPTDGPARPKTLRIIQAADGAMWFGTDTGILRFDPRASSSVGSSLRQGSGRQAAQGAWTRFGTQRVDHLIPASDGSVWATTRYKGEVLRFDPSASSSLRQPPSQAPAFAASYAKTSDPREAKADKSAGQGGSGRQTGQAQQSWTHYRPGEVGIEHPLGCWESDDGTIWVGGNSRLARFRKGQWFTYPRFEKERRLEAGIQGLSTSNGDTWIWGGGGVARFRDSRQVVYFSHPEGLRVGPSGSDGTMWFHTESAAVRLQNGIWLRYTAEDGFLDGGVTSLGKSTDGDIWAAGIHQGRGAVARFREERWEKYDEAQGVIDSPRRFLAARDGSIWVIGSHKGMSGVSRFDGKSWSQYGPEHGFDAPGVVSMGYEASDGTLWYSTDKTGNEGAGLYRFDPSAPIGQNWIGFLKPGSPLLPKRGRGGYATPLVTGFGEWPAGTLWMGSSWGLHRVALSDAPDSREWWHKTDFDVRLPKCL